MTAYRPFILPLSILTFIYSFPFISVLGPGLVSLIVSASFLRSTHTPAHTFLFLLQTEGVGTIRSNIGPAFAEFEDDGGLSSASSSSSDTEDSDSENENENAENSDGETDEEEREREEGGHPFLFHSPSLLPLLPHPLLPLAFVLVLVFGLT
jgi:hypothetical protein